MSSRLGDTDYQRLAAFRFEMRRFLAFSEAQARAAGLSAQQHQLLLAVRGHVGTAPPTIGELAERLLIKHHSAVGLVDRLVARGLIRRVRSAEDRRQARIHVTERGAGMLLALSRAHQQELRRVGPALVEALQPLLAVRSNGARVATARKAARA
jgi:DNA-binding MarR family transcriptional regulator